MSKQSGKFFATFCGLLRISELFAAAVIACCVSLTFHSKVCFILQVSYPKPIPTNKNIQMLTTKKLIFQPSVLSNIRNFNPSITADS